MAMNVVVEDERILEKISRSVHVHVGRQSHRGLHFL